MLISGKFYLYISAVHFLAQNSFAALFLYVHVYLSFTASSGSTINFEKFNWDAGLRRHWLPGAPSWTLRTTVQQGRWAAGWYSLSIWWIPGGVQLGDPNIPGLFSYLRPHLLACTCSSAWSGRETLFLVLLWNASGAYRSGPPLPSSYNVEDQTKFTDTATWSPPMESKKFTAA